MPHQPDRPNILWICTDQQRYDTIGALGNGHVHTPNLDRLVAEGVAFTHAFCQSPICTPSRASFLTGMYPSTVHACTNGNDVWAGAAPLISRRLADAGYDTGLAGKLHLAGAQGRIEPRGDDGYRVFEWSHHPENNWPEGHAYADWLRARHYDPDRVHSHPAELPVELHQTMWCAERAMAFMEEASDRPWLMSVNPFDPHAPFDPPGEMLRRFDPAALPDPLFRESDLASQARLAADFQNPARRPEAFDARQVKAAYYAMIELIDMAVGRMVEAVERLGQRERTIIIFTSDHGEMLGDHGLLLKGCRFYEGLVRVPLIISWPGHFGKSAPLPPQPWGEPGSPRRRGVGGAAFRAGLVSDALVELTDLMPTLLEACGLPIPERVQGRSLLPILTGQVDAHQHRDFVRCEYYRALNPGAPGRRFEGSYATMIRDRHHKLVTYHGHDVGELFDLDQDPGEFNNLWDDPAFGDVRFSLLKRSFDALAFAVDIGPKQVAYY